MERDRGVIDRQRLGGDGEVTTGLDLEVLKWGAQQGAGWVAAAVMVWVYRRDHLRKQAGLREAHERRDAREERLLVIIERHATAGEALVQTIAKLDATLIEHHRFAAAWTERLGAQIDAIPGKLVLLEQVPWRKPSA